MRFGFLSLIELASHGSILVLFLFCSNHNLLHTVPCVHTYTVIIGQPNPSPGRIGAGEIFGRGHPSLQPNECPQDLNCSFCTPESCSSAVPVNASIRKWSTAAQLCDLFQARCPQSARSWIDRSVDESRRPDAPPSGTGRRVSSSDSAVSDGW